MEDKIAPYGANSAPPKTIFSGQEWMKLHRIAIEKGAHRRFHGLPGCRVPAILLLPGAWRNTESGRRIGGTCPFPGAGRIWKARREEIEKNFYWGGEFWNLQYKNLGYTGRSPL